MATMLPTPHPAPFAGAGIVPALCHRLAAGRSGPMAAGWWRLFGALAAQAEEVSQRGQVCRLGWRQVGKLLGGGPRCGVVAQPGPGQELNGATRTGTTTSTWWSSSP